MIVLVTGDRRWKDGKKVHKAIFRRCRKIKLLIQGGARGADFLAKEAAVLLGIPHVEVEALWHVFGKRAGPMRNQLMLRMAHALSHEWRQQLLVLVFHSDLEKSKGTKHMLGIARKLRAKDKRVIIRIIS